VHGDPADVGIVAHQCDLLGVDETHLALDPIPGIVGGPHARLLAGQRITLLRMRGAHWRGLGGAGSESWSSGPSTTYRRISQNQTTASAAYSAVKATSDVTTIAAE